jgi:3-deoxy-7-phosphoheptulonate synthase
VPTRISDLHIALEEPLPVPEELHAELRAGEAEAAHIAGSRRVVREIVHGGDDRLLVVVGPCSIHEPESALEYAGRLRDFAPRVADALSLVMRVYFEKPRTRLGWKGLIYDPDLDGRGNIRKGLFEARSLLLDCARLGVPAASEILDLVTPQYYAELLAWGAIGARTTESPLHRQMASALSAPVGFKNPTSGNVHTAVDAILAAAQPHKFPSISREGRAIVVTTTGNPHCHLVLRGGRDAPNFDAESVRAAGDALESAGLLLRLMVDCSHGNSGTITGARASSPRRQRRNRGGSRDICGAMLESHLVEGRQNIGHGRGGLRYGQSVTDACLGWETTTRVLQDLAEAVRQRRQSR